MNKSDALKEAIEEAREINRDDLKRRVNNLVWAIEQKSQELRELKKELTELGFSYDV